MIVWGIFSQRKFRGKYSQGKRFFLFKNAVKFLERKTLRKIFMETTEEKIFIKTILKNFGETSAFYKNHCEFF